MIYSMLKMDQKRKFQTFNDMEIPNSLDSLALKDHKNHESSEHPSGWKISLSNENRKSCLLWV